MTSRVASGWRPPVHGLPVALAGGLVAACVRLPYLDAPLSSDEGGFLLVASQWRSAGTSLYGNYWVDRPPLLIEFFRLADVLGGAVGLRLLGCVLAFSVVALSHGLGRSITAPEVSPWPAIAATAFVSMPILGGLEVDGELVAVPLVLLGTVLAVRATAEDRPRIGRPTLWTLSGVVGAAALMVKQDFIDVFVFSGVLLVASAATRCMPPRDAARALLAQLISAAVTAASIVAFAATRGTSPGGLWDALVLFRIQASRVIGQSASAATHERFTTLILLTCLSGALALIAGLVVHAVRRPVDPVAVASTGLLGWELFAVLAGGSYWPHYLLGLMPGLVLAVGLLAKAPGRMQGFMRTATVYSGVIALATAAIALVTGPHVTSSERIAMWLNAHAHPGDTAVVLYGKPSILETAGIASPYPELWSLPVRVRDPHLDQLTAVLQSNRPPTWVIAWNDMSSWGISSTRARHVVISNYRLVAHVCGATVYLLGGHHSPTDPSPHVC